MLLIASAVQYVRAQVNRGAQTCARLAVHTPAYTIPSLEDQHCQPIVAQRGRRCNSCSSSSNDNGVVYCGQLRHRLLLLLLGPLLLLLKGLRALRLRQLRGLLCRAGGWCHLTPEQLELLR